MQVGQTFYLPLTPAFFLILVIIFVALVVSIEFRVLRYAYMQLGVSSRTAMFLLFGSLIGSYFNIPLFEIPSQAAGAAGQVVQFFGMHYQVPSASGHNGTIIAVNVGGAVIPGCMSFYLLWHYNLWLKGAIATAVVAAVCYFLATPVRGVGIALPMFVPVIATAIVALILDRQYVAPLAYIAGALGTLIGADLLNLDKVAGLGAPVASIGGAGTFDGIFLTSIIAVLLGSATRPRAVEPA
jgi:uncharacterized membrane protein